MQRGSLLVVLLGICAMAGTARAAPRHDVCADVGGSFAFGVSSYGSVRDWAPEAKELHGADFRFLYVYILNGGMDDPDNFEQWYVRPFAEAAQDMGAVPVFTFYQLLDLGIGAGYGGGHEADIVAQTLADPALMRTYFDNFVWLLEIAASYAPPVMVHVEPDSWGFMMWAMGVEGNDDPTSVAVQVAGSGHPDTAGFPDHAAGLGQALVALRDQYAPAVRLGWHASNFRVGTRPEVVTSFFAQMGDWDALVGEHPHVEADESTWWEPWDADQVDINLQWFSTVSSSAGIPLLLWQLPIGTTDWHLMGDDDDQTMLERFAQAGIVAALFEHIDHTEVGDPDAFRASGALGTEPPASHPAGGTAADMRARVAAYSQAPLAWPAGSLCDEGIATGGSGTGGSGTGGSGTGGSGTGGSASGPAADGEEDSGCGCRLVSRRSSPLAPSGWWIAMLSMVALGCRRGRAQGRV